MDGVHTCVVQNFWGSDKDWLRIMVLRSSKIGGYPVCDKGNCTSYENTQCSSDNHCICNSGYQWNRDSSQCHIKDSAINPKDDIYRTAMITSACFLFAILLFLVICVIRRSFCEGGPRAHSRHHPSTAHLHQQISTISGVNTLTMTPSRHHFMRYLISMEKPPTYDESMRMSIPNSVSSTENIVLPPPSPPPYFLNEFAQDETTEGLGCSLDDFPPPDVSSVSSSAETDNETFFQTTDSTEVSVSTPNTGIERTVSSHPT